VRRLFVQQEPGALQTHPLAALGRGAHLLEDRSQQRREPIERRRGRLRSERPSHCFELRAVSRMGELIPNCMKQRCAWHPAE
jgi:hypothetical protein